MLKIRLQRVGRKHDPSFRLIVADSRNAAQGSYSEMLGSYDPRRDKKNDSALKAERIKHWISVGAQCSHTAHNLLISKNIIEGEKIDVSSKKNVGKKETEIPNGVVDVVKKQTDTSDTKNETSDTSSEQPAISQEAPLEQSVSEETQTPEEKQTETNKEKDNEKEN